MESKTLYEVVLVEFDEWGNTWFTSETVICDKYCDAVWDFVRHKVELQESYSHNKKINCGIIFYKIVCSDGFDDYIKIAEYNHSYYSSSI